MIVTRARPHRHDLTQYYAAVKGRLMTNESRVRVRRPRPVQLFNKTNGNAAEYARD